jgi:hypothetical protein
VSDYQPRAQGGWPNQPSANGPADYRQGGYGHTSNAQQSGRPPRRRRRRRGLIALVVVLVVILAILGIGDQIAKAYAQNRIAQQIQSSGLNAKPSVSIEGWPFLTQVAAHDVKAIDISASNVTADGGKLPFSFHAKATGVHLNSSFNGATVDNINGQATVAFSAVAGLLDVPKGTVTLSADPADGTDAVTASAGVVGSLTGIVKLVSPSKIAIQLHSGTGLASLLGGLSNQEIDIAIPKLPAGLVVRSVDVTSNGIVATASASNTTLTQ